MDANMRHMYFGKQQGAALLVALAVLILVSMLGLVAMKSSIFSAKVATGLQTDAMVFEAAETAITDAYNGLSGLSNEELYAAIGATSTERCVRSTGGASAGRCGADDFMDERDLLKAESLSYLSGYQAIPNSQVSVTGGGGVFVDYRVDILGESEMPSYNIANYHLQETLKRGIKPGSEIE
ncbi:hypothetical protein [Halopseudomonas sp.]|uniref:hypothetical protein n=1 Tax=Halopseudomonas sp. TaxID=2901191 RepID=UPI003002B045